MQLSVHGRHIDIGDALRSHIEDSLNAIFEKYFGDAIDANVTMSRAGTMYHARLHAHLGRGMKVAAEHQAERPYAAFDGAAEHLSKRLRRYKRRLRDHHRNDTPPPDILTGRQYVLSGEEAGDGAAGDGEAAVDGQPAVIAEMSHDITTCTVSEAVMRLDLEDLPTMMFRNSAHGGLNVVYRRPDGHIGWIDPQGNAAG